ncbi:hypothetical protein ONZ45_g13622 [Pleurotus djamor]|nr:hypothetical protein ONZ45_g13622 [Pleurotus djamor]
MKTHSMSLINPIIRRAHHAPNEVLVRLFFATCLNNYGRIDYSVLRRLALVCKKWYHVATGTPELWSDLSSCSDASILASRISRTSTAPIKIDRNAVSGIPLPSTSTHIIFSEISRLKVLNLPLFEVSLAENIVQLNGAAPLLESLELCLPLGSTVQALDSTAIFGGHRPPKLHSLMLRGIMLSWTSPLLIGLSELTLDSQIRPPTYAYLCQVLSQMPSLKSLNLLYCLPLSIPTSTTGITLLLPDLCQLVLGDDIGSIIVFMTCLKASPHHLLIFGTASIAQVPALLYQCGRILSAFKDSPLCLSHLTIDTPYLLSGPTLRVDGLSRNATLPGMPLLTINVELPKSISITELDSLVEATVQELPLENVERLRLFYTVIDLSRFWLGIVALKAKNIKVLELNATTMLAFAEPYSFELTRRRSLGAVDDKPLPYETLRAIFWETDHDIITTVLAQSRLQDIDNLRNNLGLAPLHTEMVSYFEGATESI